MRVHRREWRKAGSEAQAKEIGGDIVTLAWAFDVASFALGTTGTFILFKGSLRLGLAMLAASLFLQIVARPVG